MYIHTHFLLWHTRVARYVVHYVILCWHTTHSRKVSVWLLNRIGTASNSCGSLILKSMRSSVKIWQTSLSRKQLDDFRAIFTHSDKICVRDFLSNHTHTRARCCLVFELWMEKYIQLIFKFLFFLVSDIDITLKALYLYKNSIEYESIENN